jgi:hypothetical protein
MVTERMEMYVVDSKSERLQCTKEECYVERKEERRTRDDVEKVDSGKEGRSPKEEGQTNERNTPRPKTRYTRFVT